jgi:hypothetical protein
VEELRKAYNIFGGKPKRKIPLVRTRSRWENIIRVGFREIG